MLHVADNESKVGGSYTSIIENEYNDKMFLIGGLSVLQLLISC